MTDPKPARTNLGRTLTDFSVPSEPGNERLAMEPLADVWHNAGLRSVIYTMAAQGRSLSEPIRRRS
jgi:hypothetical protein